MKKVAFIIRMYQEKSFHGGGEKLFCNLIKRFVRDGHTVHVYCAESDTTAEYIRIIDEKYDHNSPITMENFYNKVKNIVKQENYDFVISENITPPVDMTFLQGHSLANRLKKTKNPLESFLYNFRKTKKQRIKYQEKWMKQGYRRIFAVSEILKRDIVQNFGVSEDNIAVIYPGVDVPSVIARRAQPDEAIHFGLLAPGFKIKGGFVFLKALGILKKKGYNFRARIVYPKFKKNLGIKFLIMLYNLKNNVEFLDYQQDLTAFYNSIDCLVVPSIEDTFNLAVLESMACGRPVIISNNAGACEIIKEGINGFTFSNNLAEKLMYFIDNKPNLSLSCRQTAEEYSWDRVYEQVNEEIAELGI
ncbi:MAG: hypothetical protein A2Y25_07035 [Candidatus Melainabacteria bacterium GWF2_37_15]|nr:MAG: hypothetical protein A2Y25_07035 [Candidatus Melainabacteria bacterium GWF2_37_15]